jgi:hypothetical protein
MPPEALQRRRFSEKSDVWAFGVTCMGTGLVTSAQVAVWELLSLGATTGWYRVSDGIAGMVPYFELTEDKDVIAFVCGGGRLSRGQCALGCSDGMWSMLERCWAKLPKDRPSFAELGVLVGLAAPAEVIIIMIIIIIIIIIIITIIIIIIIRIRIRIMMMRF